MKIESIKKEKLIWISIVLVTLAVGANIYGYRQSNYMFMLVSLLIMLFNNCLFAICAMKNRILFLIFQGTLFTFTVGRPVAGIYILEMNWWEETGRAEMHVKFAFVALLLVLVALFVGAVIGDYLSKRVRNQVDKEETERLEKKATFRKNLQVVAMIAFYISMAFFMCQELEKLIFIQGKSYVQYYSEFQSVLPRIIHIGASFMKYSLCLFLATIPSKRRTIVPLALLQLSSIPILIVGMRNAFVLNGIFIFVYYFIRHGLNKKESWIGKTEKAIIGLGVPATVIFMSMYANIRSGLGIGKFNPLDLIAQFFYSQGVTFNVLINGHYYIPALPQGEYRNYTFGVIIDYIVHGKIGQMLFNTQPLPEGNSIINALESNSLAHNLSYITRVNYLKGEGCGTSYVLENYIDFGYIGVFVFSLIIGMLLILGIHWFKKNCLVNTIILVSLMEIFFLPRSESTGWISFIVMIQFWACIGACYLGAYLCTKLKFIQDIFTKTKLYPRDCA